MVIGFSERRQTVSESDAPPNTESFDLNIDIHSMRMSEIHYIVNLRALETGTALVEPIKFIDITAVDALFGTRMNESDTESPIVASHNLTAGSISFRITTIIIQDFSPEEPLKCYTIRILSPDVMGDRNIFTCFQDEDNKTDFYCLHTICIEDDDG